MSKELADRLEWIDEARQIAAQCWCDPETEQKIMDPVLAEAIAKRIALWMETGAQHAKNEEYWRERATKAEEAISALRSEPVAWIPVGERLPEDETPVLVLFHNGERNIGELRWETPGFEDTYQAFQYWDSPTDDGKSWEWGDITHWMPLPAAPSRETDQRENSNPAPMHGQSKTGLTGSHPGAPTSTTEPALSAEQIEVMRVLLIKVGLNPALCNMALSSLTARDEVEKMRRRVEMYRDKARGNHEAYLKLYADFVGIEGASHD